MSEVINISTPEAEAEAILLESEVKNRIKFGAFMAFVAILILATYTAASTVSMM